MAIERDLARGVLAAHPVEATQVLERLPPEEVARFFAEATPAAVAASLRVMHTPSAAKVLEVMPLEDTIAVVEVLPLDAASTALRRLSQEKRDEILAGLGSRRARSLSSLLRSHPNTAGALMDPNVLALPIDLDVEQAREVVREAAGDARYNLYAVDRAQRLVGAFNLRELLLAEPTDSLASIAHANPHRLSADADRHAIVSHPGWREVHSLPVVDAQGVYLGAVRYRTLRRLEEELRGDGSEAGATARALGDLFRTGASSLLEAMAASAGALAPPPTEPGDGS